MATMRGVQGYGTLSTRPSGPCTTSSKREIADRSDTTPRVQHGTQAGQHGTHGGQSIWKTLGCCPILFYNEGDEIREGVDPFDFTMREMKSRLRFER